MVVRPRVRRLFHPILNPARPLQSGIPGMAVQMDELLRQISRHEP